MRCAMLVLLLAVITACRDDNVGQIRYMSSGISGTADSDEVDLSYELELPDGWKISAADVTLVDTNGTLYRPNRRSISTSSNAPDKIKVEVRVPETTRIKLLRVDDYEIDLQSSRARKLTTK